MIPHRFVATTYVLRVHTIRRTCGVHLPYTRSFVCSRFPTRFYLFVLSHVTFYFAVPDLGRCYRFHLNFHHYVTDGWPHGCTVPVEHFTHVLTTPVPAHYTLPSPRTYIYTTTSTFTRSSDFTHSPGYDLPAWVILFCTVHLPTYVFTRLF